MLIKTIKLNITLKKTRKMYFKKKTEKQEYKIKFLKHLFLLI